MNIEQLYSLASKMYNQGWAAGFALGVMVGIGAAMVATVIRAILPSLVVRFILSNTEGIQLSSTQPEAPTPPETVGFRAR